MKRFKIALTVLALLGLALSLGGCPGKKMMGDSTRPNNVQQIG
jgi:hypothetical protein